MRYIPIFIPLEEVDPSDIPIRIFILIIIIVILGIFIYFLGE